MHRYPRRNYQNMFVYGFDSFLVTQIPLNLGEVYRRSYKAASQRSRDVDHETSLS